MGHAACRVYVLSGTALERQVAYCRPRAQLLVGCILADPVSFSRRRPKRNCYSSVYYKKNYAYGLNKWFDSPQAWEAICIFIIGVSCLSYGWLQMMYKRGNLRRSYCFAICGAIMTFFGTLMLLSWAGNRIVDESLDFIQPANNLSSKILGLVIHPKIVLRHDALASAEANSPIPISPTELWMRPKL